MAKKKKNRKPQPITTLELIKGVRKEMPPTEQTFKTRRKQLHRKRKHKGKDDEC